MWGQGLGLLDLLWNKREETLLLLLDAWGTSWVGQDGVEGTQLLAPLLHYHKVFPRDTSLTASSEVVLIHGKENSKCSKIWLGWWLSLGRVVTRRGHEGASGVPGLWYFLVWVLVTPMGSLCDNSHAARLQLELLSACVKSVHIERGRDPVGGQQLALS